MASFTWPLSTGVKILHQPNVDNKVSFDADTLELYTLGNPVAEKVIVRSPAIQVWFDGRLVGHIVSYRSTVQRGRDFYVVVSASDGNSLKLELAKKGFRMTRRQLSVMSDIQALPDILKKAGVPLDAEEDNDVIREEVTWHWRAIDIDKDVDLYETLFNLDAFEPL